MPPKTATASPPNQTDPQSSAASVIMPKGGSLSRRFRILIVDDEPNVAFVLRKVLGTLPNVTAKSVHSPHEALYLKESYDVIITDYRMPQMDGLTLARQLYQRHPATKIVMLTAHEPHPEMSADKSLKAILAKPISANILRQYVSGLLSQ